jgi:hypothetical protein
VATPSCDFGAVMGSQSWTIGHGGGQGRVRVLVVPIQERGVRRSPSRSRDGKKEGAGAQHGALEKRGKRGGRGSVAPRGGEGRGGPPVPARAWPRRRRWPLGWCVSRGQGEREGGAARWAAAIVQGGAAWLTGVGGAGPNSN